MLGWQFPVKYERVAVGLAVGAPRIAHQVDRAEQNQEPRQFGTIYPEELRAQVAVVVPVDKSIADGLAEGAQRGRDLDGPEVLVQQLELTRVFEALELL